MSILSLLSFPAKGTKPMTFVETAVLRTQCV
jgi:hypothetical protein